MEQVANRDWWRLITSSQWFKAVRVFALWRVGILLLCVVSFQLSQERYPNPYKDWQAFPGIAALDVFFRWDGGWYNRIITNGYTHIQTIAFFPLYPYLCRWLGYIVGNHFLAGWIISNVSTVIGLHFIMKIARKLHNDDISYLTSVLLLVFPTAIFFSAFYTEGLYLMLVSISIWAYLEKRYFVSGIAGMFASGTKVLGVSLLVAFCLQELITYLRTKKLPPINIVGLALIPLGLGAYMLFLWVYFGDPLAFVHVQKYWGRGHQTAFGALWLAFSDLNLMTRDPDRFQRALDAGSAIVFLGLAVWMAVKRYPVALWAFVGLGVGIPLVAGTVESMMRYVCVLFPAFIFVANKLHAHKKTREFVIASSLFLFSIYTIRYMNWHWAG